MHSSPCVCFYGSLLCLCQLRRSMQVVAVHLSIVRSFMQRRFDAKHNTVEFVEFASFVPFCYQIVRSM